LLYKYFTEITEEITNNHNICKLPCIIMTIIYYKSFSYQHYIIYQKCVCTYIILCSSSRW